MKFKWVKSPKHFVVGMFAIAWGLGFFRYLGNGPWFFPFFPNILDVLGLFGVGVFVLWEAFNTESKSTSDGDRGKIKSG